METSYDIFNRSRKTSLTLCNPNGEELCSLGLAKDIELSNSFKEASELTFTIPKYKDKSIIPYYDEVISQKIVKVENYGMYLITDIRKSNDGILEEKQVNCISIEIEWASKQMGCEGTYKFYDPINPANTMMGYLLSYVPAWSIKEIDSELWETYRTFDETEMGLYNFVKQNVEKAYDCIFIFDRENRQVSVKKTDNALFKTNIFLSTRNLIKKIELNEDTSNIFTAVNIYGDGDLSIASVNPLGTATLYDFTYYATESWMGKELADKVIAWQTEVDNAYIGFGTLLSSIKDLNSKKIIAEGSLKDLEAEKKSLEQKLNLIAVGKDGSSSAEVNSQIKAKEVEINNKKTEINNLQLQIDVKLKEKKNINDSLAFENNFTEKEYKKLSSFIKQTKVVNDGFMTTDQDTYVDIQNMMEELYEWGKRELRRQSQPVYTFSLDVVDFMKLPEFKDYARELDLGAKITICLDRENDSYVEAVLLKYTTSLNSFDSDLTLEFANVLNYNSSTFTWEDLFNSAASLSSQIGFEGYKYKQGAEANAKIDEYTKNALDLSKQDLLASDNQEFIVNNLGIRGREWDEITKSYLGEQIWMTKNKIVFTDNAFNTIKQAIGKITLPDGSQGYGIIANAVIGNLLCGKALILENENNTFRVDGNGVYMKNANIVMTTDGEEQTLTDVLGGIDKTIQDSIGKIDLSKYDNVLTADGMLDTTKMKGQILAGTNNILCVNNSNNKALLMNDTGILIANSKSGGTWSWKTAISADGIVADAIKAGGTLQGCKVIAGDTSNGIYTMIDADGTLKGFHQGKNTFLITHTAEGKMRIGEDLDDYYAKKVLFDTAVDYNNNTYSGISVRGRDSKGFYINTDGKEFLINGNLRATGTKNSIVKTENYGIRALYAEESERSYFTSHGKGETHLTTDGKYQYIIRLNEVFLQTIDLNSVHSYMVDLTSYSENHVWVKEVYDKYIVIQSKESTVFDYTVRGVRKDYYDKYLEEI